MKVTNSKEGVTFVFVRGWAGPVAVLTLGGGLGGRSPGMPFGAGATLSAFWRKLNSVTFIMAQAIFVDMFGDEPEQSYKPVCEVCERITVGVVIRPASHYVDSGIPALRTLNIKPGWIDESELVHFSAQSNDGPLAKSKLKAGDVVISRTGHAGIAATVPPRLDGANAIDRIVVSPAAGVLDSLYFEALLNSDFGARLVAGEQRGQIQQHFRPNTDPNSGTSAAVREEIATSTGTTEPHNPRIGRT